MKKTDIETVEDALKYIDLVEKERDDALKGKADAETAANDAIKAADDALKGQAEAESKVPAVATATVKGIGKVRVNFGVDGIEKADLVKDHEKIAKLVEIGSGAVTVIEKGGK